jgi:putative membrane protein
MKPLQSRKGIGRFLIAAIVAAAVSACATSREQPSAANTSANAQAVPAARPIPSAAQAKVATARAKHSASRATPSTEGLSKASSAAILAQIHRVDLKEIAIGKIADEKASTNEVRDYADQLAKDHTSVDQMVIATAGKMNLRLQDNAALRAGRHESSHSNMAESKLNSASAAAFDRLFLQQTSADHEKLIRSLKQEREDASDDDIEALIDEILPIIEQHEQLAQILLKKEQA